MQIVGWETGVGEIVYSERRGGLFFQYINEVTVKVLKRSGWGIGRVSLLRISRVCYPGS